MKWRIYDVTIFTENIKCDELEIFSYFAYVFRLYLRNVWCFGAPMWLTMLGRVVFPLFMFLAADSFYYTYNRKAYLKRLLFMTWFMIIGNMIVSHFFTNGQVGLANNAFGAFFLAGISICAWDLMVEGMKEEKLYSFWKGLGLFLLPVLLALPALFLSGYLASENISPLMVQLLLFLSWLFRTFSWLKKGMSWFTLVFSFISSADTA